MHSHALSHATLVCSRSCCEVVSRCATRWMRPARSCVAAAPAGATAAARTSSHGVLLRYDAACSRGSYYFRWTSQQHLSWLPASVAKRTLQPVKARSRACDAPRTAHAPTQEVLRRCHDEYNTEHAAPGATRVWRRRALCTLLSAGLCGEVRMPAATPRDASGTHHSGPHWFARPLHYMHDASSAKCCVAIAALPDSQSDGCRALPCYVDPVERARRIMQRRASVRWSAPR